MRTRNEKKQEALFEATIQVVNTIGFAASSVSKIAKAGKMSAATVYIYHKNKEDLLISTFLAIKRSISQALLENFDPRRPIRDIFETVWFNMFRFAREHSDYMQFSEQFANSPYVDLVDRNAVEKYFDPLLQVLEKGIEQKVIKNVSHDIFRAFMFYPIIALLNARFCTDFEINDENIRTAFGLAWDAVKL